MLEQTRKLWEKQDQHEGDRWRLFRAIGSHADPHHVLYPGSYVDVSPSFVFPSVTYVDVDRRAAAFFKDTEGVNEIIRAHDGSPQDPEFRFIHQDYTTSLDVADASCDLLVSLYAGFISEACTTKLRIGGTLLANPSHGDVAMASIDPRYQLVGAVIARSGNYRVKTTDLDIYLAPRKPANITKESLHESGRGIAYTKSAFAYIFERIR